MTQTWVTTSSASGRFIYDRLLSLCMKQKENHLRKRKNETLVELAAFKQKLN